MGASGGGWTDGMVLRNRQGHRSRSLTRKGRLLALELSQHLACENVDVSSPRGTSESYLCRERTKQEVPVWAQAFIGSFISKSIKSVKCNSFLHNSCFTISLRDSGCRPLIVNPCFSC